jgi:hypothetical protein
MITSGSAPKAPGVICSPHVASAAVGGAACDSPRDVQHTLLQLTAHSIAGDIRATARAPQRHVCGGGAMNAALMQALQQQMPALHHRSTAELGLPVNQVEAAALPGWPGAFAIDYLPTCRKLPAHPDAESWEPYTRPDAGQQRATDNCQHAKPPCQAIITHCHSP